MSLPWEIEKISSAFFRANSVFSDIYEDSKAYTEGLTSTLSLMPFDFSKHNLFM